MRPAAPPSGPLAALQAFLRLESAAGLLLVASGLVAMIVANSPARGPFEQLLATPLAVSAGAFSIDKPLLLWINDGLMAVFFLLVGLEIKREVADGPLSDLRTLALPAFAAVGGMLVPALIFAALNAGDPEALRGWATPAATDIAFALGVLSLFGSRVPAGLKMFLLTLAILDDLGAIVIIALFYTAELSLVALTLAGLLCLVLLAMNRRGAASLPALAVVGAVLWACVLKSGVHATLAGVVVALAVPLRDREGGSPLRRVEHALHPWVAFGILPVFALANAGVPLQGFSWSTLLEPVPLGIGLGLFVGKQAGVAAFAAIAVALGLARLPDGVTWRALYGAAIACGIGFTMSLFIASLAYGEHASRLADPARAGILAGTLLSSLAAAAWLHLALPRRAPA